MIFNFRTLFAFVTYKAAAVHGGRANMGQLKRGQSDLSLCWSHYIGTPPPSAVPRDHVPRSASHIGR